MKDNHPEAAKVTLGGRERTVKVTLGAIDTAATRHGYTFTAGQLVTFSLALVPRLTWAALLPDDPDLPFERVEAWMGEEPEAAASAAEAAILSFNRLIPLLKKLNLLGGAPGKAPASP